MLTTQLLTPKPLANASASSVVGKASASHNTTESDMAGFSQALDEAIGQGKEKALKTADGKHGQAEEVQHGNESKGESSLITESDEANSATIVDAAVITEDTIVTEVTNGIENTEDIASVEATDGADTSVAQASNDAVNAQETKVSKTSNNAVNTEGVKVAELPDDTEISEDLPAGKVITAKKISAIDDSDYIADVDPFTGLTFEFIDGEQLASVNKQENIQPEGGEATEISTDDSVIPLSTDVPVGSPLVTQPVSQQNPASVISGSNEPVIGQIVTSDLSSKHQTMSEGEALLARLAAANSQLKGSTDVQSHLAITPDAGNGLPHSKTEWNAMAVGAWGTSDSLKPDSSLNNALGLGAGGKIDITAGAVEPSLVSAMARGDKPAVDVQDLLSDGKFEELKGAEGILSHRGSGMTSLLSGINAKAADVSQTTPTPQSPLLLTKEMAGEQLSERMQMMVSKDLKHVDIRLDPPELGKLQIKLSVNNDQASVQITVGNQQTRDMVEQAMPRLREMLNQQGLQLLQGSVQQDTSRQFAGQFQQQHGQQGESAHSSSGSQRDTSGEFGASQPTELWISKEKDGVDYYA